MSPYRLADHLGTCEVDGRTVMLDLRRDRYFLLDADTSTALRRWRAEEGLESDDPAIIRLNTMGMIVSADATASEADDRPAVPTTSLLDQIAPLQPGAWSVLPEVAAIMWGTRRRLSHRGLQSEVDAFRRRKPSEVRDSDPAVQLARFRAARRLVPIAPTCLTDSLALAAFLASRGIPADLVFGVKLDPFAAHCWLQNQQAILNDAADAVTEFTPIMAV